MTVKNIASKSEFDSNIASLTDNALVVLDCYAVWCGPCRVISPAVDRLSSQWEAKGVKFYKVDVDEVSDVAQELAIRAMPTFIFFKNGEIVNTVVGANERAIIAALEKYA